MPSFFTAQLKHLHSLIGLLFVALLASCATPPPERLAPIYTGDAPLLSLTPTEDEREDQIDDEDPEATHFYGRRYFVKKTRFWGYIRKSGEGWNKARLAFLNEDLLHQPDRVPEKEPELTPEEKAKKRPTKKTGKEYLGPWFGYDQNYEYKLTGHFTGREIYDPNSNSFFPEFQLKEYELLNKKSGWIFSPNDRYAPDEFSLRPF